MSTDSTCGHGTKDQAIFDENTIATPYKNYGQSKYNAEKYILEKPKKARLMAPHCVVFGFLVHLRQLDSLLSSICFIGHDKLCLAMAKICVAFRIPIISSRHFSSRNQSSYLWQLVLDRQRPASSYSK